MKKTENTEGWGVLSLVVGAFLSLFTLFGVAGVFLINETTSQQSGSHDPIIIIIMFAVAILAFVCGIFGLKKCREKKNFGFYNAIFLLVISALYLFLSIDMFFPSTSNFVLSKIALLIFIILFLLLPAALFIINGVYLVKNK